ncbi:hypothetical protein CU633_19580 [Bacillus sp. V3-13]|uniref:hypothetical protein n=1 Tax=Bacillus sp. V3-13 TaxID=2053728 RepID=UPI000C78E1D5|nr:hypothetical protein [Bacillus sp. V3-13]PLR75721.1 hypothetical protein CU633_19580 [Bacillus sp. V3-13]
MKFKSKKCYLVYGIAANHLNAKEANYALNSWIKNQRLGKIIYHEHFASKPLGGIAIFEVTSQQQLDELITEPNKEDSFLYGWDLNYHPLIHSTNTERFIYQVQYTLSSYRGLKMEYVLED